MIILTRVNKKFKELYLNNAKYMYLFDTFRNFIVHYYDLYDDEHYYEYRNCKNNYIRYFYYNILICISYFNYSGEYHRENGPAYIKYFHNGRTSKTSYFLNNKEYSYEEYLLKIKKSV